jgi:hypothetical protein
MSLHGKIQMVDGEILTSSTGYTATKAFFQWLLPIKLPSSHLLQGSAIRQRVQAKVTTDI